MKKIWNNLQDKYSIFCPYYWRDLRYQVSCFFFHRNKWVIKSIPRSWVDLDTVYENVLFAGLVNYVEGEKCFDRIMWTSTEELAMKAKIEEIYTWIKTGRSAAQKEIEAAYPEIVKPLVFPISYKTPGINNPTYEQLYGEVNRLEKLFFEKDTEYLTWLVVNRQYLWT